MSMRIREPCPHINYEISLVTTDHDHSSWVASLVSWSPVCSWKGGSMEPMEPVWIRHCTGSHACNVILAIQPRLSVHPQVTLSPATVPPVEEGGSFTLTCADSEGTPPPTFEWRRDNQVISGTLHPPSRWIYILVHCISTHNSVSQFNTQSCLFYVVNRPKRWLFFPSDSCFCLVRGVGTEQFCVKHSAF